MLALELSSYVLVIPNVAYTKSSQKIIGCPTLGSRVLQVDWLILEYNFVFSQKRRTEADNTVD